MTTNTSGAPNQATEVREKVLELEQQLLTSNPLLPTLLRTIHTALRADPEIVTLLSDEEISVVVRGLMKHTQTTIAAEVVSKLKAPRRKPLSQMTLEDL